MSFSDSVKEKALVSSARHCCICHRYKGIKVEVHHILPVKKGGDNNFENAIVLCFDCHADAGHYYANHPKGKKFSPSELRKQRDAWHAIVKNNKIPNYEEKEIVHCRYYATIKPFLIKEIADGYFSRFPIKNILVHDNPILRFQKKIISNFELEPIVFDSTDKDAEKKYLQKHPDIKKVNSKNYPYYSYTRIPNKEEVIKTCNQMEACKFLLSIGEEISNLFRLLAFHEPCGGTFQERFQIRPIMACYLCITNISAEPLNLANINFNGILKNNEWGSFSSLKDMPNGNIVLPQLKVVPNESIVIPILTLLAPFEDNYLEEISTYDDHIDNNEVIEIKHIKLNKNSKSSEYNVLGPGIIPRDITLVQNEKSFTQSLHQFNLSNMYIYDNYFMCGSCPYVFFSKKNDLRYYGEVFTKNPNELQTFKIIVPYDTDTFILKELEYEETFIMDLKVNKKREISNRTLKKGDSIKIPVKEGDIVEGVGCYYLNYSCISKSSPMHKNNIIKNYMFNESMI